MPKATHDYISTTEAGEILGISRQRVLKLVQDGRLKAIKVAMTSLRLNSFRLRNFKAVRDSGEIHFTPLTVFIGNNGSGKSSLIEGLKAFRDIAEDDLVDVMQSWHGFENVRYQASQPAVVRGQKRSKREPREHTITFEATGHYDYGSYEVKMEIGLDPEREPRISREEIRVGSEFKYTRDTRGVVRFKGKAPHNSAP